MPITWKNVSAPSNAGVSEMFKNAGQSMQDSLGTFQKVIQDRQEVAKNDQVSSFKEMLNGARTPEELQALREQGQFEQARQGFSPSAMKETRGLVDNRLTGLREASAAEYAYDQAETGRRDQSGIDRFTAELNGFSSEGGVDAIGEQTKRLQTELAAAVENNEISQGGANQILGQINTQRNALENDFWGDNKNIRAEQKYQTNRQIDSVVTGALSGYDPTSDKATATWAEASKSLPKNATPAQRTQAKAVFDQATLEKRNISPADQRFIDAAKDKEVRRLNLESNIWHNDKPEEALEKANTLIDQNTDEDGYFLGIKDDSDRKTAINGIRSLASDGYEEEDGSYTRVPAVLIKDAVAGMKDGTFPWTTYGELEDGIKDLMDSPAYAKQYSNFLEGRDALKAIETSGYSAMLKESLGAGSSSQSEASTPTDVQAPVGEPARESLSPPTGRPGQPNVDRISYQALMGENGGEQVGDLSSRLDAVDSIRSRYSLSGAGTDNTVQATTDMAAEVDAQFPSQQSQFPAGFTGPGSRAEREASLQGRQIDIGARVSAAYENSGVERAVAQIPKAKKMGALEREDFLNTFGSTFRQMPEDKVAELVKIFGKQRINQYL